MKDFKDSGQKGKTKSLNKIKERNIREKIKRQLKKLLEDAEKTILKDRST